MYVCHCLCSCTLTVNLKSVSEAELLNCTFRYRFRSELLGRALLLLLYHCYSSSSCPTSCWILLHTYDASLLVIMISIDQQGRPTSFSFYVRTIFCAMVDLVLQGGLQSLRVALTFPPYFGPTPRGRRRKQIILHLGHLRLMSSRKIFCHASQEARRSPTALRVS